MQPNHQVGVQLGLFFVRFFVFVFVFFFKFSFRTINDAFDQEFTKWRGHQTKLTQLSRHPGDKAIHEVRGSEQRYKDSGDLLLLTFQWKQEP